MDDLADRISFYTRPGGLDDETLRTLVDAIREAAEG